MARGGQHAGLQTFLTKGVSRFCNGAFVISECVSQVKRVLPVELRFHRFSFQCVKLGVVVQGPHHLTLLSKPSSLH